MLWSREIFEISLKKANKSQGPPWLQIWVMSLKCLLDLRVARNETPFKKEDALTH